MTIKENLFSKKENSINSVIIYINKIIEYGVSNFNGISTKNMDKNLVFFLFQKLAFKVKNRCFLALFKVN